MFPVTVHNYTTLYTPQASHCRGSLCQVQQHTGGGATCRRDGRQAGRQEEEEHLSGSSSGRRDVLGCRTHTHHPAGCDKNVRLPLLLLLLLRRISYRSRHTVLGGDGAKDGYRRMGHTSSAPSPTLELHSRVWGPCGWKGSGMGWEGQVSIYVGSEASPPPRALRYHLSGGRTARPLPPNQHLFWSRKTHTFYSARGKTYRIFLAQKFSLGKKKITLPSVFDCKYYTNFDFDLELALIITETNT